MGSLVLEHETLVAVDAAEDGGLLDTPGADVLPLLLGVLLLGVAGLPSAVPAVGELLEEGGFEGGGLGGGSARSSKCYAQVVARTVKVGFSTNDGLTLSTTEAAEPDASAAADEASSAMSARARAARAKGTNVWTRMVAVVRQIKKQQ
ncbi:hypothetical protein Tdes44962_MAKER06215 [Teratosphaeria destructans]|uniref:Uncharacterized protein n=1 Tax=Teratosphaeria destructans TaxID=418781 RepID=A0A9W7VXN1_9PEZI|nr:hypothetical protein Tdes44962_MAKER06215 [Teratosphaeria destructans]